MDSANAPGRTPSRRRRGRSPGAAGGRIRAILDAALVRFARDGYENAPVAVVAADAGVASGTIIYHFQTKDNLLAILAWETLNLLYRRSAAAAAGAAPGLPRVLAFLDAFVEFLDREPDRVLLLLKTRPLELAVQEASPGLDIRTLLQCYRALLENLLHAARGEVPEPGWDAAAAAAALVAHLAGWAWLHLFFGQAADGLASSAADMARTLLARPCKA